MLIVTLPELPGGPHSDLALSACPGLHYCMLLATDSCSQVYAHPQLLQPQWPAWSLATGPGGATEDQAFLCTPLPCRAHWGHTLVHAVDHSTWADESRCPHTWHPAPLDPGLQHASVSSHPQVKVIPWQSQSIKYGIDNYIFKSVATYARLQEAKKWANMIPPKEYSKLLVTYHKEMEMEKMPNREFKIIVLSRLRMLQQNTDKQLTKIKKTIQEQNEKFKKWDSKH